MKLMCLLTMVLIVSLSGCNRNNVSGEKHEATDNNEKQPGEIEHKIRHIKDVLRLRGGMARQYGMRIGNQILETENKNRRLELLKLFLNEMERVDLRACTGVDVALYLENYQNLLMTFDVSQMPSGDIERFMDLVDRCIRAYKYNLSASKNDSMPTDTRRSLEQRMNLTTGLHFLTNRINCIFLPLVVRRKLGESSHEYWNRRFNDSLEGKCTSPE